MLDFSYLDLRLLFPNIAESWVLALESFSTLFSLIEIILIFVAFSYIVSKKYSARFVYFIQIKEMKKEESPRRRFFQ